MKQLAQAFRRICGYSTSIRKVVIQISIWRNRSLSRSLSAVKYSRLSGASGTSMKTRIRSSR